MRGQIICIGDELISGRVTEANAAYAAARLTPLGIAITRVVVVGDDPAAMAQVLRRSLAESDFLLVTGGLGATDDDLTAQVAAEVFEMPLTESQQMVKRLRAYFQAAGLPPSAAAEKMAWMPRGAELLSRFCSGFRMQGPAGQPVYFLPGVPAQMRDLTDRKVVPELARLMAGGDAVFSAHLRCFGLPEPEVGARLSPLAAPPRVSIGYYPEFPEVHVVLTVRHPQAEEARRELQAVEEHAARILGRYLVVRGSESLEQVVVEGLATRGLTLALAESCTGGLIGHRLTQVPGASAVLDRGLVVYSNEAKMELLGVAPETLARCGAVSAETAGEMAAGARQSARSDLGLAVTGIAGPGGGSRQKPVGTVFFALAGPQGLRCGQRRFVGLRTQIKALAAENGLNWLRRYLEDDAFLCGP